MNWPAGNPYMNCIENCWGILVQAVYERGRPFETLDDLKNIVYSVIEKTTEIFQGCVQNHCNVLVRQAQ